MAAGQITKAAEKNAQPAQVSRRQVLRDLLEQNQAAVSLSLPASMDADRFRRLLLTAANSSPQLMECDPRSFLAAGVACAQLGLEPNDPRGLAYLIPFNDKRRGKVVQLIIGYRGLLDLARRSGMVGAVEADVVYRGDVFEYERGLHDRFRHIPGDHEEDPDAITHVWARARVAGDLTWLVMTRRQVDKIRDASPGARSESSPWRTHYVEMAQKTALRRLCKWLPLTVEAMRAVDHEESRPLTLRADPDEGQLLAVDEDEDAVETTAAES